MEHSKLIEQQQHAEANQDKCSGRNSLLLRLDLLRICRDKSWRDLRRIKPEHGDLLKKLHQREIDAKLTKAALETLAIIAYKQPILRADIEAIRGVACGETVRNLMEKHLVKIAGRAEEPGRPILYGTTKRFLELFGLNSVKDLPQPENGILPPTV